MRCDAAKFMFIFVFCNTASIDDILLLIVRLWHVLCNCVIIYFGDDDIDSRKAFYSIYTTDDDALIRSIKKRILYSCVFHAQLPKVSTESIEIVVVLHHPLRFVMHYFILCLTFLYSRAHRTIYSICGSEWYGWDHREPRLSYQNKWRMRWKVDVFRCLHTNTYSDVYAQRARYTSFQSPWSHRSMSVLWSEWHFSLRF